MSHMIARRMILLGLVAPAVALTLAFTAGQDPPASPSSAPSQAVPPPADRTVLEDQPIRYTLREGDTLEAIAEKWYGNRDLAARIVEANPNLDPANLVVGETIVLPRINLGDQLVQLAPLPEGEVKILQAVVMKVEGLRATWRPDAAGDWKQAAIHDILPVGAEIRTGRDSLLALRIGMNASIIIDRDSRVDLPEMAQHGAVLRTRMTVRRGLMDVKVDHVGLTNDFEIKTPSATLAVKGTGWRLVWDAIDGFQAFGVPTNRIRAIEIAYVNGLKVALTADDASTDRHQLPALTAFAQTYFLPLAGAVSPEEMEFLTMVVTHGRNLVRDLGLDESFGREGFTGTIEQFTQDRGQDNGCGCQFESPGNFTQQPARK